MKKGRASLIFIALAMFLGRETFSADKNEGDSGEKFVKKRRVSSIKSDTEDAAAASELVGEESAAAGSIFKKNLLSLPPELVGRVLWYLEEWPQNARNLSITCRALCGAVRDSKPLVQVYFSRIETLTLFVRHSYKPTEIIIESPLGPLGVRTLMSLFQKPQPPLSLRRLVFSDNLMEDEEVQVLAPLLLQASRLEELDFNRAELGPAGAAYLVTAVPAWHCLWHLNLDSNDLGNDGVMILAPALAQLRALRELFLASNGISLSGVRALVPVLPFLRKLDLGYNAIDDDGVIALASALLPVSYLQELVLSSNPIGDTGAAALVPVLAFPDFQELYLDGSPDTGPTIGAAMQQALLAVRPGLHIRF